MAKNNHFFQVHTPKFADPSPYSLHNVWKFCSFFGGFPMKVDKEVRSQDKQSSAPCTYPLVKANVTK